jgi:hypothetical protein
MTYTGSLISLHQQNHDPILDDSSVNQSVLFKKMLREYHYPIPETPRVPKVVRDESVTGHSTAAIKETELTPRL